MSYLHSTAASEKVTAISPLALIVRCSRMVKTMSGTPPWAIVNGNPKMTPCGNRKGTHPSCEVS